MARVRHDELTGHESLAVALRWLRHRRRLTQAELRARVQEAGGEISVIYIQQLEAGRKRPSPQMLDRILRALEADRDQLREVLAGEAAEAAAPPVRGEGWRPSARDPLADSSWSGEVLLASAAPGAAPAAAPADPALEALTNELRDLAAGMSPTTRHELLLAARRLAARRR